jgi:hypothetical protein
MEYLQAQLYTHLSHIFLSTILSYLYSSEKDNFTPYTLLCFASAAFACGPHTHVIFASWRTFSRTDTPPNRHSNDMLSCCRLFKLTEHSTM